MSYQFGSGQCCAGPNFWRISWFWLSGTRLWKLPSWELGKTNMYHTRGRRKLFYSFILYWKTESKLFYFVRKFFYFDIPFKTKIFFFKFFFKKLFSLYFILCDIQMRKKYFIFLGNSFILLGNYSILLGKSFICFYLDFMHSCVILWDWSWELNGQNKTKFWILFQIRSMWIMKSYLRLLVSNSRRKVVIKVLWALKLIWSPSKWLKFSPTVWANQNA